MHRIPEQHRNRMFQTGFLLGMFLLLVPAAVSALAFTSGPTVQSVSSDKVTITWETDVDADAVVTVNDGVNPPITRSISAVTTSHTVIVDTLNSATTYTFTATSTLEDGTETATGTCPGPCEFTTPSAAGDTSPPVLLSPFASTTCGASTCTSTISFQSNESAKAELMWGTTAPTDGPLGPPGFDTSFSISISGLDHATDYVYTIRLEDTSGNWRVFGLFSFTTCNVGTLLCFSVGQCEDGTPLNECNSDGELCNGGTLELNCTACGYECQVGSTCKSGGACIDDPPITDSTYQCNPTSCYDGSSEFIQPAGPGCFKSWPRCNSNVVLRVRNDRECKRWIDCKSAIEVKDTVTQSVQQLCTHLGNCARIDVTKGECIQFLPEGQCEFNPGRFCTKDDDCTIFDEGDCIDTPEENAPLALNFEAKRHLSDIRYLTGSVKSGFVWRDGDTILGQFPWALASQEGSSVNAIDNNEFEDVEEIFTHDSQGIPITKKQFSTKPWFAVGGRSESGEEQSTDADGNAARIIVDRENPQDLNNPNHTLWIYPNKNDFSGARAPVSGFFATTNELYKVTLRIKATTVENQYVMLQMLHRGEGGILEYPTSARQIIQLTTAWQTVSFQGSGLSSATYIQAVNLRLGACADDGDECSDDADCGAGVDCEKTSELSISPFLIDDVYIQPVLSTGEQTTDEIARSCRLFPRGDSLSCAYEDANGLQYRGWSGYCLERDPGDASRCVSWWPVDVIAGDTAVLGNFGGETTAGYDDRKPLYVCLESVGYYNTTTDDYQRAAHVFDSGTPGPFKASECDESAPGSSSDVSYSFHVCGDDEQSKWDVDPSWEEAFLREYEIDFVEVIRMNRRGEYPAKFFLSPADRKVDNDNDPANGDNGAIVWEYVNPEQSQNIFKFRVIFDKPTPDATARVLKSYWAAITDDTGTRNESGKFAIIYHLREYCKKLVQVVDENGQSRPWAQRVGRNSTYRVPDLNYGYTADFAPFGGVVQPAGEPESWDGDALLDGAQPVFVELPQSNDPASTGSPYQARAGSPYACYGNCSGKVCTSAGDANGNACNDVTDCVGKDESGFDVIGRCIGVGTCELSAGRCTTNDDCPTKAGTSPPQRERCIGGAASSRRGQALSSSQTEICQFSGKYCDDDAGSVCKWLGIISTGVSCVSDSDCGFLESCEIITSPNDFCDFGESCVGVSANNLFAARRAQRLFAESYGAWIWNKETEKYERMNGTVTWSPPTRVCSTGFCDDESGKGCGNASHCDAGVACKPVTPAVRPTTFNPLNADADYCGIPPHVFNVRVNNKTETRVESDTLVKLTFNTSADPNQVPLDSILVNWDPTAIPADEQGLSFPYAPRTSLDDPHVFLHAYDCPTGNEGEDDDTTDYCTFKPKALVRDNWGFCNNYWNDPVHEPSLNCDSDNLDTWAPNAAATEPDGTEQEEVIVKVNRETP